MFRDVIDYFSETHDSRNKLGTFFKIRNSVAVAWNSRHYNSFGEAFKLYWIYIPPLIYIPAVVRYILVMTRHGKKVAKFTNGGIPDHDMSMDLGKGDDKGVILRF